MIIECDTCKVKVDAKELGSHLYDGRRKRIALCLCPVCETVLLGESQSTFEETGYYDFAPAIRLWPQPYTALDSAIPEPVRRSIEDTRKCYQAGVYSAAAVMCGRALEYITVEKTGEKTLYKGLCVLREKNQIDDRLLSWAEILCKERNMGAHGAHLSVVGGVF